MTETSGNTMFALSSDESFHYELTRVLGLAPCGGSDLGEVLMTVNKIKPGDFESWTAAFTQLADETWERAQRIDAKRHPVSARNAYFCASSYYRSADFFLHGNPADSRINTLWERQTVAFDIAIGLLPIPGERVTIKGDGFDIPLIFYKSDQPGKRPTVLLCNGYDGAQEEMFHVMVQAVVERGMNAITFEGPGQPTVRRQQNIGFIPEWERVVTPVIDYALSRDDVDPEGLASMGYSFGGLLMPRAAAFDHRLAAVFALDGVYDFGATVTGALPKEMLDIYNAGDAAKFNEIIAELLKSPHFPTTSKWAVGQGMWSFCTTSAFGWAKQCEKYTLEGVIDKIKTPVFVGDAEGDIFFKGQAEILANKLGGLATYHVFKTSEGAGQHCSVGASVRQNQVVLDWFEDLLEANRAKKQ